MKINKIFKSFILFQVVMLSILIESTSFSAIFTHGSRDKKVIAITFDDGPNNSSLPKILDLLKENDIKASFFFLGNNIKGSENEIKRTFDEGHLILNHSYSHSNFGKSNTDFLEKELITTNEFLNKIIGVTPRIFRPPYGAITPSKKDIVRKLGFDIVFWDVDTKDWSSQHSLENVIETVKRETRPGSIILMHTQPNKFKSYEALKIIIPYFKEKGYTFVKLDELLEIQAYE